MNKNIKIISAQEGNDYHNRNLNLYKNAETLDDERITSLIKTANLKSKSVLEIGCATGIKLEQYQRILNSKINYGIDLSSKAIAYGKKKYKNLKLLRLSSLQIDRIKINFDLIICGSFLCLLDREEIFNQFNLIYKKIKINGHLIISDFDPLFKHTNYSLHNKKIKIFKAGYDNFLEESGLFKVIYKSRTNYYPKTSFKKSIYKSYDNSTTLYQKINFENTFPMNI